jgi:hypothetical protein
MPVRRITVALNNINIGVLNQSYVGFTTNNTLTDAENAAACLLYIGSASQQMMAANSQITGCTIRAAGAAGSVPQPFPLAEYAALQGALAGPNVSAIVATSYGGALGGGGLTALGTSMVVSEETATTGRTGRGRHFLPFVTQLAQTAAGLVNQTNASNVEASYDAIFVAGGFIPVVCPENLSAPKPVTRVVGRLVLSNLRTRRK